MYKRQVGLFGNVSFSGAVNLKVNGSLNVATTEAITRDPVTGYVNAPQQGGILSADAPVTLSASYLSLGQAFAGPLVPGDPYASKVFGNLTATPSPGSGSLILSGSQIDVGNLCLEGISSASMTTSSGGMIRGDGSLVMTGDLSLSAGVISPANGTTFQVIAFPTDSSGSAGTLGSIKVSRSGTSALPWSAVGTLAFYSQSITQGGELAAPYGSILLGRDAAAASVTDPISRPVSYTHLTLPTIYSV